MTPAATTTARERARAEVMREIVDTGRIHLARDGAAGLSLRAVARDLGMVSSAVYRYVPNRDALLTLLIVDAYDALGTAVEKAERAVPRDDFIGRFLATAHAVRKWALAHPHEYALVYGSPVPGYAAPEDTIGPASRVPTVLVTILVDLQLAGAAAPARPVEPAVSASIDAMREFSGGLVPDDLLLRGLASWGALLGAISLELFGHLHNVVAEGARVRTAYFDHQMMQVAIGLGLGGD